MEDFKDNVILHLKKVFLWTHVSDKRILYNRIKEHLPVKDVQLFDDRFVLLNFGMFGDIEIKMSLNFVWKNGTLIEIERDDSFVG
jgi:hypothetical protein